MPRKSLDEIFGQVPIQQPIQFINQRRSLDEIFGRVESKKSVLEQIPESAKQNLAVKMKNKLIEKDLISPDKETFVEGVKSDIEKRSEKLGDIADAYAAGTQGLLRSAFQTTGQAIGGVWDVLFRGGKEAIKAVTPDVVEEKAKQIGSQFLQTAPAQKALQVIGQGLEKFEEWKNESPENEATARDLEATFEVLSVLPITKVAKVSVKSVGKTAGKTAGVLEKTGQKALQTEKESFIRRLVRPLQTKKVKEAQVARTTETGKGIFKRSIIAPTGEELAAEKALLGIKGIDPKKTVQQNYNVIQEANKQAAKKLTDDLVANDFIFNKNQLKTKLNQAKENLQRNPVIVGDAEKTADKLITEVMRRTDAMKNKGSELLKLRREFDQWVKSQKGANIFDPNKENVFSVVNREIRGSINDFIDTRAVNVQVKESLRRQSSLYNAMENLVPKAAQEADTAFGRSFQRVGQILGTKSKIVQGIAAGVGIGGLGAAATFAPIVALLGGTGFLVWQAGRLVASPKLKLIIAKLLRAIEVASKKTTDPIIINQLQIDKKILEEFIK